MLCRPASAEAAGQWVVKQWTSSPPPPPTRPASQPSSSLCSLNTAARLWDTEDFIWTQSAHWFIPPSLYILSVWLLFLLLLLLLFNFRPEELFWIVFSFRNFHLWFANMGSSCGFSRGNIVALFLLLVLEGKVHHQFSCHWKRAKERTMKLQTNAKCCTSVFERFWKQNKCSGLNY